MTEDKYDITFYWCASCYWYPKLTPELFPTITNTDDVLMAPCPKCDELNEITLTRKNDLEEDRPFLSLFEEMNRVMKTIIQAIRNKEAEERFANLRSWPDLEENCIFCGWRITGITCICLAPEYDRRGRRVY